MPTRLYETMCDREPPTDLEIYGSTVVFLNNCHIFVESNERIPGIEDVLNGSILNNLFSISDISYGRQHHTSLSFFLPYEFHYIPPNNPVNRLLDGNHGLNFLNMGGSFKGFGHLPPEDHGYQVVLKLGDRLVLKHSYDYVPSLVVERVAHLPDKPTDNDFLLTRDGFSHLKK